MTNQEIKEIMRKSRFFDYEIAAAIGISEYTFCKWFRRNLTEEQQGHILTAISTLKASERHEN